MQKNRTNLTATIDNALISDGNWQSLRAPFGYYGAKRRLASQIIAELPPHNAWVEAFCGSAALTLAKRPAQLEVINDINGEVVNFFSQLRNNSSRLCQLLRLTPYAREELRLARLPEKNVADIERARRFFVAAMMAINGSFGESPGGFSFSNSYSRRNMEARVSRWKAMPDHLELIAKRLSQVRIENKDSIELFSDFSNRPATLVYFDPPYLADRTQGYDHDQCSEEYHERLLITASNAKCMVFLSGYENDLYNDYLTPANGWHKRLFKATTRGHNGKDSERHEIVWYNEKYANAVISGRVPVHLSAKERQQRKVNPMR
ncbi:DNA adenine methylase [bacterium]|nr:MAG: DNA adenine methylase [bacterium]